MNDIVNLLGMDWRSGLIFIAALIIVFVWVIDKWDWIVTRLGLQTKFTRREAKQDEDITELKEHAKKTDENFEKILSSVNGLQQSIKEVSDRVAMMQKRNDESEMNQLRDRIGQSYRYYKAKGCWNEMEKEAFNGLIASYEKAGGTNGFVHSIAIPASLEWQIIDE